MQRLSALRFPLMPILLFPFLSVLLLLELSETATAAENIPFQSIRAPAETIRDYEIHVPIISKVSNQDYPGRMVVEISQFKLHMELNSGLIHPKFTSRHFDQEGHEIVEKGHVNCFYQGKVEGHPEWQVTMTTCHGLQGSFGELWNTESFFHLEPLDSSNTALEQPHALYSNDQYSERTGTCGTTSSHKHDPVPSHFPVKKQVLQRRQVNGFYFVEWVLINDMAQVAQYTKFDQNLTAVVLRDLSIANFVDMTYRTLRVRVVVVDVITWSNGNQISYPANNDANTLLDNLSQFATTITIVHDSTMLITGVDLLGSTVGLANLGTMCNDHFSVGLSQDGRMSVEGVGSIAAHELGHLFNMEHDDGRQCTCTDPVGSCIMSSVSSFPSSTRWSSCSRSDIANGFTSRNLNRCLKNEPLVTVADPICGNGIRERNEICDCGSVAECTDPCCNATTCTLRQGATCSQGSCCSSDCQFLVPGTTCRSASQECDIMEYCTGDSSDCPRDVYKQDGTTCKQGDNYCFAGTCQSLDNQCQQFFRSQNSVLECYTRFNILGIESGNCGTRNGQFVACAPEHAQCGQLMCDGGSFQGQEVSVSVTIYTRTFGTSTCVTFSNAPTSDTVNPGLVPDGVKCGNESLCVSQKCTAISALDYIQPCPLGSNGQTCADAGMCNNLNMCSCNVGFTGNSCEQRLRTSSGISGGFIAGIVFGVLLALALVVVVAVFFTSKKGKSMLLTVRTKVVTKLSGKHTKTWAMTQQNRPAMNTTTVNVVRPSAPPRGGYNPPQNVSSSRPAPPPNELPPSSAPPPYKFPPSSAAPPYKLPPSRVPPPRPSKALPAKRSAPPPRPSKAVPPPPKRENSSAKPPPAANKPSKLQQQWPPPNGASSAAAIKPLLPQKKPMAPVRR